MYRITKDGREIAVQDRPLFIRKNPKNGLIVGCAEEQAQGVAAGEGIYHLEGKPALPGAATVRLEAFDGAAALTETKAEMENILTEARAGLAPVPLPGAAWNAQARYIREDTATVEGAAYVALRYNRGKSPADSPADWSLVPAPSHPAWNSIEDGSVILEGVIVMEGGRAWICTAQHIKSTVYKPKAGSSKWAEYEP